MSRLSLNPKLDFQRDPKRAGAHQDIMANPRFTEAAKSAMLTLQYQLNAGDPQNPAAIAVKIKGAQQFLDILLNLGEPDLPGSHHDDELLTPPEMQFVKPSQKQ